jgi:exodeoxyribonuclease V alpha subunit
VNRLTTLRDVLRPFQDAGVLTLADVHTAVQVCRLGGEPDEHVRLALALAVRALRHGSVCLELDRMRDVTGDVDRADDATVIRELAWPATGEILAALQRSPLVIGTSTGPLRPLTLVESDGGWLLYLSKYFMQEQTIRRLLTEREQSRPTVDTAQVVTVLGALFRDEQPPHTVMAAPDRQRVAVAVAATEWITIVVGGPGTGKTHIAARILALLYAIHGPTLRVALAAPTGKSAAQLGEAVTAQAQQLGLARGLAATTLHRLLGWRRDSTTRFVHNARNRLPYDVIVLDETSMVSLTMMARLLEALRPQTRLILMGDPDQLASVDAGAVLADLVNRPTSRTANPQLQAMVGADLKDGASSSAEPPIDASERAQLAHGVVLLRRGHRFAGAIADFADAVRQGRASDAVDLLTSGAEGLSFYQPASLEELKTDVTAAGTSLISAALQGNVDGAIGALGIHRLLCAHREGPYGVRRWSRTALDWTAASTGRLLDPAAFYPGQPLLVTANDYEAGVNNGDIGVVINTAGGLIAVFERVGQPLLVHPSKLSSVETVYAMTIHRSQGSQYTTVSVILPTRDSALLTRELLYTAITRARRHVRVIGTIDAIVAAVDREVQRASGLRRPLHMRALR